MRFYNSKDLQTAINRQETKLGRFHYAMKYNPKAQYFGDHVSYPSKETLDRAYEKLDRLYSLESSLSYFSFSHHFHSKEKDEKELYVGYLEKDYADIICVVCDKKQIDYEKSECPNKPNYIEVGVFLTPEQKKSLMYLFSFADIEPEFTFSFSNKKPEPIEDIDEPRDCFECGMSVTTTEEEDTEGEDEDEEDEDEEEDEGLHEVEGYMVHDTWDV